MDSENEKTLQELIHFYCTKFPDDAKILREGVADGEASSIFPTLLEKISPPFRPTSEKLFHSARLFYFLGYCLDSNNGIPFIEILNNTIDNSKRDKVINAVKSQKTLIDFLVRKGVDKADLEEYVAEKETIEYAIDENNKSTGVLKLILARKQITENEALVNSSASNENISQNKKPQVKEILPFFKHLLHNEQEKLADLCISIFNKNKSPKDYAIMLCLLSENKYIVIQNKGRKVFFEEWYKFINEPLPYKDNYIAINKHIVDKAANGFVFKDETDSDYCNLKEIFDKALTNNNLH